VTQPAANPSGSQCPRLLWPLRKKKKMSPRYIVAHGVALRLKVALFLTFSIFGWLELRLDLNIFLATLAHAMFDPEEFGPRRFVAGLNAYEKNATTTN